MEYLEINKEKIIAKDEGQGAHTLLTRVGGAPPTSWAPWWLSDDHLLLYEVFRQKKIRSNLSRQNSAATRRNLGGTNLGLR